MKIKYLFRAFLLLWMPLMANGAMTQVGPTVYWGYNAPKCIADYCYSETEAYNEFKEYQEASTQKCNIEITPIGSWSEEEFGIGTNLGQKQEWPDGIAYIYKMSTRSFRVDYGWMNPTKCVGSYSVIYKVTRWKPWGCAYGQLFDSKQWTCSATDEVFVNKSAGKPLQCAGNPVNIATGNKFQAEVDFKSAGSLNVVRYFNSETLYDLGFGIGWTSPIKRKLMRDGDSIIVLRDDGYAEGLQKVDGVWAADADSKIVLTEDANGFILTEGEGAFETYDVSGKLINETNMQGQTTSYNYNSEDQLTTIIDHFGRELIFTYNPNGQVESITTPGNKTLTYSYDENDRLASFTNQENTTRYYHYENDDFPYALTGITDEDGNRYATWSYDEEGRAISSEHANGVDKTTLTYNADGTTTVTNPLGKQTTYHFTTIHGVKKVTQVEGHPTTSCEGANKNYQYDANGNVISKTDWNGVTTTYTYDMTRNLELSRTEAVGTPEERAITTEWHPDFRLPVKITEPGKITEYSYDSQGRKLLKGVTGIQ